MITKELIKKDNDNGIFNLKFAIKNTIEYLKEHQKETITLQQVTDSLICQVLKEGQIGISFIIDTSNIPKDRWESTQDY